MKKIKLTKGQYAIVDDEDYKKLSQHRWYAHKICGIFYARRSITINGKGKSYSLHWAIIGKPPEGLCIDHINGNGLDNRKRNLRFCSTRENSQNTERHRMGNLVGASRLRGSSLWRSQIKINGKNVYLGLYDSPGKANLAYMSAKNRLIKKADSFLKEQEREG